jgi:hypothetical protein
MILLFALLLSLIAFVILIIVVYFNQNMTQLIAAIVLCGIAGSM